jgi:hypothetical protein
MLLSTSIIEESQMFRNQRGQALVSAIIGVALVVLVLLTTLSVTQYSHKAVARQLNYQGLAINAATAGLNEALSWFRRQTAQPVVNFTPAATTTGPPPVNDSDNATVGLVRNYTVSNLLNVNGTYTLRRTGSVSPVTNTIDVTSLHGKTGTGVIWQLESEGLITASTSGNVIAKATLRAEIQRLGMNMPAAAALTVSRNNCINTGTMANCKVRGGASGAGIAYVPQPSGTAPSGWAGSAVVDGSSGTTVSFAASPNRFTFPYMFDVTQAELTKMANYNVTDCTNGNGTSTGPSNALNTTVLPNPMPSQMSLTIINCTGTAVNFTSARPLGGAGIVYVIGNVNLAANMNSTFNGVLYVQGTFTANAGSVINGQVIVDAGSSGTTQTVNIAGLPGNFAEIRYDPVVLTEIAQQIGTYNFSRTPYVP